MFNCLNNFHLESWFQGCASEEGATSRWRYRPRGRDHTAQGENCFPGKDNQTERKPAYFEGKNI